MIRRLGKEIKPLSDRIMTFLLTLIQTSGRQSPILEDAFLCVGAMASTLEGHFQAYAEAFMPFLSNGLQSHEEYSLCGIAVGLVGDICRALGEQARPYAQGFMEALMAALSSAVLHRSVKPPILSCFGDIAMAIGPVAFDPYLQTTMNVLAQAGGMRADPTNYDLVEYVNTLREGILEAYTGIVSAYKQTPKCKPRKFSNDDLRRLLIVLFYPFPSTRPSTLRPINLRLPSSCTYRPRPYRSYRPQRSRSHR